MKNTFTGDAVNLGARLSRRVRLGGLIVAQFKYKDYEIWCSVRDGEPDDGYVSVTVNSPDKDQDNYNWKKADDGKPIRLDDVVNFLRSKGWRP